jgi:hypothetical protein
MTNDVFNGPDPSQPGQTERRRGKSVWPRAGGAFTLIEPFSGQRMSMSDDPFTLRQVDQLRVEVASLETSLELVMAQLARLPTRAELARIVLLATAPRRWSHCPRHAVDRHRPLTAPTFDYSTLTKSSGHSRYFHHNGS